MRWLRYLALLTVIVGIALALPAARHSLMSAAGRALVSEDSLERVDAIVIAVDADGAGVLEAADLVHQGVATRVAVFADPPSATDRELLRRGVRYHDEAAFSAEQLAALGVSSVEVIPRSVAGTNDEGAALPSWCSARGYRSVLLVTTADHSRRARRILQRDMQPSGVKVLVRASRYSGFDPNAWWQTRSGIRIELVESEKLLLDVLAHPLS
jgi:uncharacterized SAM-binding protein YcdF (DUF218 family)